jgi:hypothetical protein
MLMNETMNPLDLTVNQLKRAAAIKERIEDLNKELRSIFGAPANTRAAPKKKRTMSAAAKKQLAAARKARWANLRRANPAAPVKRAATAKKKTVSRSTRAKLSAKLKAYWAAKKKSSKK